MNKQEKLIMDISLLKEAIIKWTAIVDGTGYDDNANNCALCQKYNYHCALYHRNLLCPIAEEVGYEDSFLYDGCSLSPWKKWAVHHWKEHSKQISRKSVQCDTCKSLATDELVFIQSILDKKLNERNLNNA